MYLSCSFAKAFELCDLLCFEETDGSIGGIDVDVHIHRDGGTGLEAAFQSCDPWFIDETAVRTAPHVSHECKNMGL